MAQDPVSPATRDRRASGTFTDTGPTHLVGKPAHHPIKKMIDGSCKIKETQLLGSSRCDGILFVHRNQLGSINIPKKGFDLDEDPDEINDVIAGALGTICSSAIPAYIELTDAVSDALVLCTEEEKANFHCSDALPKNFFVDSEEALPGAINRPPLEGDLFVARVPRSMPRPIGCFIQEGNICDDAVLDSCLECHPDLGAWLLLHRECHQNSSRLVTANKIRNLDEDYLPDNFFEVPTKS